MNLFTRARKHIDMNRVKELREEKIKEETIAEVQKQQENILAELKKIEIKESPKYSNWRRECIREFGEWAPIETSGPTNSTSTTFGYFVGGSPVINFETGQQVTFIYSGLDGVENYPTSVTIDQGGGETFQTTPPPFSQIGVQGYPVPLGKGVMRRNKDAEDLRKKQYDENLQKIKDTLKDLGTSWEEMRANNWALVKPDGTSIVLEPIIPGNKQLNWIDNSKITVGKKHRNAGPNQNPFKVRNPDGSITIEFSEIVSVKKFEINDRSINNQLDSSEKYTKQINADVFMKGRVDDIKPAPKFTDTDVSISREDEKFIDDMSHLPKGVDALTGGLGTVGDLAIKYAKGDMTPVTSSPGPSFDKNVLNMINKSLSVPGVTRGSVTDIPYNIPLVRDDTPIIGGKLAGQIINMIDTATKTPTRAALGQFHYEINSSGIEVIDRFNFNDNKNIGALADVPFVGPKLQDIANRLVDIGDRRAIQNGQDPRSDNYGIPIKYTIPWDKVPPGLQNKLDPTATIIPTIKRRKRRRTRKGVQESTWKKLNRHRGS